MQISQCNAMQCIICTTLSIWILDFGAKNVFVHFSTFSNNGIWAQFWAGCDIFGLFGENFKNFFFPISFLQVFSISFSFPNWAAKLGTIWVKMEISIHNFSHFQVLKQSAFCQFLFSQFCHFSNSFLAHPIINIQSCSILAKKIRRPKTQKVCQLFESGLIIFVACSYFYTQQIQPLEQ